MAGLWDFIASPENRAILAWLGGGACVVASGFWVVLRHFAAGPAPAANPAPRPQATARDGVAAAGDVTAGRDIRIGDLALPRLALGLAALGMVLLALAALLGRGDTITGSVTAGDDIENSTISVTPPPPSDY